MTTDSQQSAPREEIVEVWDGRIALRVKVAGQGAPLLYLHGSTGLVWDPFLAHLAERYTVYAPEFPGTSAGDPDAVHVIDQLSDLVLAYEELCRRLGLVRPVIVGHDVGGMLAAELSAAFPELPERLVLISALGLWREDLPVTSLAAAAATELPGLLFHDPAGEVAQAALTPPADPEAAVEVIGNMVWSIGSTAKFIWPIPDRGLRARLHRVTAATLVVWGREDRLAPAGYADEFAGLIPGARAVVFDASGHLPQLEQFKETVTIMEEFFK
ncbi:alpha/beta hydrolase [Streptomyces sp. NPDC019990]|uniref:alpha/beta fold hydrolase n=1 Tax=Streptomyces sp. NPDC019990 TaxID=3154693 RepID=UPI0033E11E09